MNDQERELIELVIKTNRGRQSQKTGYISQEEAINSYDNFLFCLALFRSRSHDNVLEAKKLLEKLLYFQQSLPEVGSVGNFPVLLSDYPFCNDHLQALRILYVLLWIMREFSSVLGAELRLRVDKAIGQAKEFLQKVHKEVKFPYWAKVKLAVSLDHELLDLADTSDMRTWGDPHCLAEMIIAYQLQPIGNWKPFWDYLRKCWHRPSHAFVGPAFKLASQSPLLQLAMGLFLEKLPQQDSYPLQAALLRTQNEYREISLPHTFSGANERFSWQVVQEESYAYATVTGQQSPELMPGFFPVHLVAGSHSLCLQAPSGYSPEPFVFTIPEAIFQEDREKARALVICFDDHKETDVLVNGEKATCFDLTNTLEIQLGKQRYQLAFSILSGDGCFLGHISRSNRSGRQCDRFTATDVQVFIRACHGTLPTTLQVTMTRL